MLSLLVLLNAALLVLLGADFFVLATSYRRIPAVKLKEAVFWAILVCLAILLVLLFNLLQLVSAGYSPTEWVLWLEFLKQGLGFFCLWVFFRFTLLVKKYIHLFGSSSG
ncbi:MAG: hypothetical protein HY917_05555 [Candidatus Diapherotrites archaeon]|nr:hypothetical protein [Candidatus Diapherotrites archaeon]